MKWLVLAMLLPACAQSQRPIQEGSAEAAAAGAVATESGNLVVLCTPPVQAAEAYVSDNFPGQTPNINQCRTVSLTSPWSVRPYKDVQCGLDPEYPWAILRFYNYLSVNGRVSLDVAVYAPAEPQSSPDYYLHCTCGNCQQH